MSHYAPILAAVIAMLLTAFILSSKLGKNIQDVPNERSLHKTPVPRVGGVPLMAGILSGWGLMIHSLTWWLVLPLLALFMVSLLDDIYSLQVKMRLLVHVLASVVLVVGSGLLIQQGVLVALAMILLAVWVINLYNFMDGSDGLAGGMALFGFSFYGIAALIAHDDTMAMMNFTIGAAALGFLFSNFYPAKIFMGDVGSIPLGFLAIGMGAWGWQLGHWPAWFPLLVFSPFIMDASVTLARRTLRGVKVTEAHCEHYYQRAVQLGWGHRNIALFEYVLMMGVGCSALWALNQTLPWKMLLIWSGIYVALMLALDARWNKTKRVADV